MKVSVHSEEFQKVLENSNAFPTIDWTNGDDYDIANKKSKARAADAKSNKLRHDAQTSDQIHTYMMNTTLKLVCILKKLDLLSLMVVQMKLGMSLLV